jgi:hypothetical protein
VTCGERAAARLPPPPPSPSPSSDDHAPSLPGAPGFDETYRWLCDRLPGRLRKPAKQLPWKLGLTPAPDGRWGDFVRLHPNRELPLYAAQAPGGGLGLSAVDLGPFLRAHHLGAFAWLVRDRLEDGQVLGDDQLLELAEIFEERWREAIVDGTGKVVLAETLFRRANIRWQRGTRAEKEVLARGSMRAPIYAAIVREKLGWIAAPSQALLQVSADPHRLTPFLHAHDLYLCGLQVIDDVIDADEDCALRGASVPGALGCSPGALVRVAPKLVRRAAATAAAGGFTWFATWLDAFAGAISSWRLAGDGLGDELDAIGIAGEIEEAIVHGADIAAARPTAEPASIPA